MKNKSGSMKSSITSLMIAIMIMILLLTWFIAERIIVKEKYGDICYDRNMDYVNFEGNLLLGIEKIECEKEVCEGDLCQAERFYIIMEDKNGKRMD